MFDRYSEAAKKSKKRTGRNAGKLRDFQAGKSRLQIITTFSKLSIFSDLNNLDDISMQPEYAAICGITEDELKASFAQGIARLAENNGMTPEQTLTALAKRYDGYRFAPNANTESVYNPFSLLMPSEKTPWATTGLNPEPRISS